MRTGESARDLEALLGALAESLGRAASRDPKLRPLLAELRKLGLEARLSVRLRVARPGSPGFAIEVQTPWSSRWNREDVEVLHALGIALESDEQRVSPPEPDGRSHR
ncbi:MAG: hypothetical protein ACP5NF_01935 [Thermoanaerobaculum sp.]